MNDAHIIKKYCNRRLYDSAVSRYITLQDVLELVKNGTKFKVVDAKSDEDITRSILLQIILEQEERGRPIFTNAVLEQIIRSYGEVMQGFMTLYLEKTVSVLLQQQAILEQQMTAFIQDGPVSAFGDVSFSNINLWKSIQESILDKMVSRESRFDGASK